MMKKIALIILALVFIHGAKAQLKFEKLPKSDTSKYTKPKAEDVYFIEVEYGGYTILNPQIFKTLEKKIIQRVEFVYTAYPKDYDFTELNNKRLANLYLQFPDMVSKPWTDWEVIAQTGCANDNEAAKLFHGFVVYTKAGADLSATHEIPAAIKQKLEKMTNMAIFPTLLTKKNLEDFFTIKGIKISNLAVNEKATNLAIYEEKDKSLKFIRGLLMTTGDVKNARGPNYIPCAGSIVSNAASVDKDLQRLVGKGRIFDLCKLEFDMEIDADSLVFEYCFGSEEYPEFLNFNDVFGLFISGKNLNGISTDTTINMAKLPRSGIPISVKNINHTKNQKFYLSNDYERDLNFFRLWQYDGFIKTVRTAVKIERGRKYHFKLAIADFGDPFYDSGIFIKGFGIR